MSDGEFEREIAELVAKRGLSSLDEIVAGLFPDMKAGTERYQMVRDRIYRAALQLVIHHVLDTDHELNYWLATTDPSDLKSNN